MAAEENLDGDFDWAATVAERKIQEAIDEGLFDNLPGKGQPLDLSVNPFEAPGMGAINRILKHNKVLPLWIMVEKEIEASRALALAALARWEASEAGLRGDPLYAGPRQLARDAYGKHMRETNDLILKYNLSSPFALRAPIPFMMQRRLREFDEQYGAAGDAGPNTQGAETIAA